MVYLPALFVFGHIVGQWQYKINLPGWRWARIKQLALVGLSSSWHSEVCNALGDSFGVAHSKISVCGYLRPRGCQQYIIKEPHVSA